VSRGVVFDREASNVARARRIVLNIVGVEPGFTCESERVSEQSGRFSAYSLVAEQRSRQFDGDRRPAVGIERDLPAEPVDAPPDKPEPEAFAVL